MMVPIDVPRLKNLVLNIPCAHCGARVGEPCRTQEGELTSTELPLLAHIARIAPVWAIYKIGFQHGRRSMKQIIDKERQRGNH